MHNAPQQGKPSRRITQPTNQPAHNTALHKKNNNKMTAKDLIGSALGIRQGEGGFTSSKIVVIASSYKEGQVS